MTQTETAFLPLPTWLANATGLEVPHLEEQVPTNLERVILKIPVEVVPGVLEAMAHEIPEENRAEILPTEVCLIWERTLAVKEGGQRVCTFAGVGIASILRTIVDLRDGLSPRPPQPPPEKPSGPVGIVTEP